MITGGLFDQRIMRVAISVLILTLIVSCKKDSPGSSASSNGEVDPMTTVVFQGPEDPDTTVRILWQRSYPEEYAKLIERAKPSDGDPFHEPINIQDAELTPGTFGLLGWDKAVISRSFDQLGKPLENGAAASYDYESNSIRITHAADAINLFRTRFPDFKQVQIEADAANRESPVADP